jgi:hypothetical protein
MYMSNTSDEQGKYGEKVCWLEYVQHLVDDNYVILAKLCSPIFSNSVLNRACV